MRLKCLCVLEMVAVVMTLSVSLLANEPFLIYEGKAPRGAKQPQAFVSSDGIVHLTFGVGNQVFYGKVSSDAFASQGAAFEVPNLALGMRRGPRIAATNNSIVITAIGGVQGKGKDGDVQAYRSEDQGETWAGPIRVNDVEASAREGLHAMTVTDRGVIWCTWLDLRSNKTELYASHSDDNGRTWSKNLLVYRSPDGSVCECCHPSIAAFGEKIHILFRNSLAGNRDMYLISSTDDGKTFGQAQRQGIQSWQLNGCPMDGGMLAVDAVQNVFAVWRRDRSIISSRSKLKSEVLLGSGEQPWITSNVDGFHSVWVSNRDGDLYFKSANKSEPERIGRNASFPIVVSQPGQKALVHVFWETRTGQVDSVMGQRIQ